jgi:peptidoglycan/xylan/chitin deacetylase (PgdA/CDA1 family)
MAGIRTAKSYKDLTDSYAFKVRTRAFARESAIYLLSLLPKTESKGGWVWFLGYHHVFNDEKRGFQRHLAFLKNRGDIISIDDAVDMFRNKQRINGRYFCITFDDGFKNCIDNALPILLENKLTAAFFVPTDYIGCDVERDKKVIERFFSASKTAYPIPVEFMDWGDCRKLIKAGMTIGSHTASHAILAGLNEDQIKSELIRSKQKIEEELGLTCRHFCCPWGLPKKHFMISRDPLMAKEAGYHSFITLERGPNLSGTDPFRIKRRYMLCGWSDYQLRYLLQG